MKRQSLWKGKWAQNYNTSEAKPNWKNYQANHKNAKRQNYHPHIYDVTLYTTWWFKTRRKSFSLPNFLLWSRSRISRWRPQKWGKPTMYSGNIYAKGKYRKSSRIFIIITIWYRRTRDLQTSNKQVSCSTLSLCNSRRTWLVEEKQNMDTNYWKQHWPKPQTTLWSVGFQGQKRRK